MPRKLIDATSLPVRNLWLHDDTYAGRPVRAVLVEDIEKAEVVVVPGWIPVTESLPGYHKRVLVYVAHSTSGRVKYINTTVMAYLTDIGFICCEYGELLHGVAHWMPLPESPEVSE